MVGLSSYFLTIASVSAVLAGICVTLRNFSYSTLIAPESSGLTVGEKDYPKILRKSAFWATLTSVLYLFNTALCLLGLLMNQQSIIGLGRSPSGLAVVVGLVFFLGIILLTVATLVGFFQTHQPGPEEPAPTEPMDNEE